MGEDIEVDIGKLREALRLLAAHQKSWQKVYAVAEQVEVGIRLRSSVPVRLRPKVLDLCQLIAKILGPHPCSPYMCERCDKPVVAPAPRPKA